MQGSSEEEKGVCTRFFCFAKQPLETAINEIHRDAEIFHS